MVDQPPSPPLPPIDPRPSGDGVGWSRLHPITVLRELVQLAWNLVLILIFSASLGDWLAFILPGAVVALGVARYFATTFAITPDAVLYRRGVVFKSRTELPRERIQNVTTGADVFGRIFDKKTVTISSAGAEGEIKLAVLDRSDAALVVGQLLGDRAPSAQSADRPDLAVATDPQASTDQPATTERVPSGEPVLPGEPSPRAPSHAAVAPPPQVTRRYLLTTGDFVRYALTTPALPGLGAVVLALLFTAVVELSLAGLVVLFGLVVPILVSLDLFEFRLDVEPDRLLVRHGLISTREKWARRERIQLMEVRRPWLRRVIGYETLAVATADVSDSADTRLDLCVPLTAVGTWPEFAPDVIDSTVVDERDLHHVSRWTIRRRFVRSMWAYSIPIGAVTVALAIVSTELDGVRWWWPLLLLPVAALVAWRLALRSYRVDGWATSTEHLLVRRGRFSSQLRLVRLAKIQDVELRSTFFQRRHDLASVLVDTANVGAPTVIPDLDRTDAELLARQLAGVAAQSYLPDGV